MIKVILKNKKQFSFSLSDEKKETDLVLRFHQGLDADAVLKIKTGSGDAHDRIKVSDIMNMQYLKEDQPADSRKNTLQDADQESRFKTREEYEKWKKLTGKK